jgi:O-antigen ligase
LADVQHPALRAIEPPRSPAVGLKPAAAGLAPAPPPHPPASGWPPLALVGAVLAASLPTLLAYNVSPSATFFNQALALGLWALWLLLVPAAPPGRAGWAAVAPVLAALGLMAGAALWAWGPGALPGSLARSSLALLAVAGLLLVAGAGMRARADAPLLFACFCAGLLAAALANVGLALVQVFAPAWADGDWLARPGTPGRAVGNLRQPNHLSSVLTWGCVALVVLLELRHLRTRWAAALLVAMVAAIVLTASRTGLVSVLLLALWGALDRRLARPTRALLLAAPLAYALAWGGMALWAQASEGAFAGAARLAETDISSSRFAIWSNTLALIAQQPWAGVGWGHFNFAWTLTPFPGRPTAFFDHAHNLPLHLLAELGLPLGLLVLGLLLVPLGRAAWAAWVAAPAVQPGAAHRANLARRGALMLVLMISLHSLLEYPLWYAYFLLPAAWALGFALPDACPAGAPAVPSPAQAPAWRPPQALAALLLLGTLVATQDFMRVAGIFTPQPGAAPLAQRIAQGQRSLFFAHHADYAAATSALPGLVGPGGAAGLEGQLQAFDRASHYLLDTRLMRSWAQALQAAGQDDAARHLAARLREFRKAEAAEFFAPCEGAAAGAGALAAASATAFPCRPPAQPVPWRWFAHGAAVHGR